MKTKKQIAGVVAGSLFAVVLFAAQAGQAQQDVKVSTGYDDAGPGTSPYLPVPDPWYGSLNTTFYGNAAQAQDGDPDEDAILLQNLGGSAVSLTAASIGGWDLFAMDSIGGPVTLLAGQYVILAGVDGSDSIGSLQTVSLTLGGIPYSYLDVTGPGFGLGALGGHDTYWESVPWTPIYTPNLGVPDESSTLWLAGISLIGLGVCRWRFGKQQAA